MDRKTRLGKLRRNTMAKKMTRLDDLYVDLLKDLYHAEKQLVGTLPKLAKAASASDLRNAFEEHLNQTKHHVERIERIFSDRGNGSPKGKKCVGMEGIIEEGKELMKEKAEDQVMDAGLIAAAQKAEHYEIACYGTARAWAQQMGYDRDADLLQQTLEEESAANEKLTRIAESHVNVQAR
jgi:ferritin-like metal-binding protein YciE